MPKRCQPEPGRGERSLTAPIAGALAVKAVALAVLYLLFFAPGPVPTAANIAAAVIGPTAVGVAR